MNPFSDLYTFIKSAEKNRNYPSATAAALKSALRLVEVELTDEEKNSVDLLSKNLEKIFTTLYSKSQSEISVSSLETYKRRIKSLINDYNLYGKDPAKMAAWDRKPILRKKRKEESEIKKSLISNDDGPSRLLPNENPDIQSVKISLSNGEAQIIVPKELRPEDAKRLKLQIDLLANIFPDDK